MEDFESGHDDSGYPHDWRGNDIGVFTPVIWRQGTTGRGQWKIGKVVNIRNDKYEGALLDIEWDEESSSCSEGSHKARGVKPHNVTVFHEANN